MFATDELLIKARDLNAFQRPSKRDYTSFRTWFWNVKPLSYEREEQFIKRKEDLISLRHGREWSGFDGFIESCVRKMHCKFTQVQQRTLLNVSSPANNDYRKSLRPKNSAKRLMTNASTTTRNHASRSW